MRSPSARRWLVTGGTVLLLVAGYLILRYVVHFDFREWWASLGRFGWPTVGLALGAVSFQLALMVNRLWVLFPREAKVAWGRAARAMCYGQTLNHFVPARAGDVVKAIYLKREGDETRRDLPVSETAGVIIADKVIDTAALLLVILSAMAFESKRFLAWLTQAPLWPVSLGLVALAACLFGIVRWLRRGKKTKGVENFLNGLKAVRDPRRVLWGVLFGAGVWVGETLAMRVLCASQGYALHFDQLVWVLVVLNLGVAIPISLANVGTFEASMALGLTQLGVPLAPALAIATVHHALQILGVALWSGVLWLLGAAGRAVRKPATA